jgi:hypothetical protein
MLELAEYALDDMALLVQVPIPVSLQLTLGGIIAAMSRRVSQSTKAFTS